MTKDERDREMWERRKAGASLAELAEAYGLSEGYVGDICRSRAWCERREELRREREEGMAREAIARPDALALLLALTDYVLSTYQPMRWDEAERIREMADALSGEGRA